MNIAEDARRARRAFIREHHPDRGGDPQCFIAGLERFSAPLGRRDSKVRVVIRPTPSWRGRIVTAGRRVVRREAGPPRVR
jgi:hypothetical protein